MHENSNDSRNMFLMVSTDKIIRRAFHIIDSFLQSKSAVAFVV